MSFSLEAGPVFGAVTAVADCRETVTRHVQAVDLVSHGAVHEPLAGVYHQFLEMGEVKEAWTKGAWHHGL